VSARGILIALLAAITSLESQAQPPPQTPAPAKPTEATCRAYVQEGLAKKNYDEARELFHSARLRCGNMDSLILIARTYELQGDLPRALAYLEEFLAVVDRGHESRAAVESAATVLRERVPAGQRVSIAAELSARSPTVVTTNVVTTNHETAQTRLTRQVEEVDYPAYRRERKIERARGLFVGASFAYAARAKVEVRTESMNGSVDFPAVFAAEAQVGYRFFPFLSVALAPQMLFNLKPDHEDSADELGVFVQTTGHLALKPQWDLDLFVAPGYSVLIVPGADNAKGLAFRWGGGPMFHLTEHVSFAAEFSHQLGFQRTERDGSDVDMETTFFSMVAGVRLRL
jgi:hypothetical protein